MRDIVVSPIFVRLGARLRGPKETTKVGTMRRILISNLTSYNCASRLCSILSGIPDYAIEDVKLDNIYQHSLGGASQDALAIRPPEFENKYPDPGMFGPMPSQGFFLRHIRNLEMSHVEIAAASPDPRPSFYLDVSIFEPTSSRSPRLKVFPPSIYKVTDLRILLSRAAKDTQLDNADNQTI